VDAMAMEELRLLDAGSWYSNTFAGERIPELWQLLELIKPTEMLINLELKSTDSHHPGLQQAVLDEFRKYDMLERAIFSSFHHASITLVKELEPRAETALLYRILFHRTVEYAQRCGVNGIHPAHSSVDKEFMDKCREAGLKVRPWTVDEPGEAERLAALGVDALISNCPEDLLI
jgi:glycerophosphoryl diester phosphodiesterase